MLITKELLGEFANVPQINIADIFECRATVEILRDKLNAKYMRYMQIGSLIYIGFDTAPAQGAMFNTKYCYTSSQIRQHLLSIPNVKYYSLKNEISLRDLQYSMHSTAASPLPKYRSTYGFE